jgi:hypothetical protein
MMNGRLSENGVLDLGWGIEIEIEIVYNMYRMRRFFTKKPDASAAVSGPCQLCQTGNLQVRARP